MGAMTCLVYVHLWEYVQRRIEPLSDVSRLPVIGCVSLPLLSFTTKPSTLFLGLPLFLALLLEFWEGGGRGPARGCDGFLARATSFGS